MGEYDSLRHKAFACNLELFEQKLCVQTFGNASCLDSEKKVFAIKPSGVSYKELRPDMIVIVDLNNNIIEGDLSPSSDTKTHTVLYNHFPSIRGIVHTHSTYAVAWAQAKKPIPILGTTHADHCAADIPCTKVMSDDAIARDYETETGLLIAETFGTLSYEEIGMVLVANHGPFTWGMTPEKAVYNSIMLEEIAKMASITLMINPKACCLKPALIQKHYLRKHGRNAYYGQKSTRNQEGKLK